MKRHLIAAVIGLAASMPTLALDFVSNNPAQSPVGAPFPGEAGLQTIVDTLFPSSGIDVTTDQSSAAFWSKWASFRTTRSARPSLAS